MCLPLLTFHRMDPWRSRGSPQLILTRRQDSLDVPVGTTSRGIRVTPVAKFLGMAEEVWVRPRVLDQPTLRRITERTILTAAGTEGSLSTSPLVTTTGTRTPHTATGIATYTTRSTKARSGTFRAILRPPTQGIGPALRQVLFSNGTSP